MTKDTTPHPTPIIDWELGLKLAGSNKQLAIDIMSVLTKSLPGDLQDILAAKNDPNILLQRVHKLHGAISYCGLPRLKKHLAEFELALKHESFSHLDSYFEVLTLEVNQVLDNFAETNAYDR